ncbi:MAG: sel1 repeat family protein [Magnetococcales bacterium]|nr:sel1 repeat family protein [Magnetococcales bacterium]
MRITGWIGVWLVLGALLPAGVWAAPEEDYKEGLHAQKGNDLQAAMVMFRRGAEAGHVLSMVALAVILDRAEENEEAGKWYRKAADAGEPSGILGLGVMQVTGELGKGREPEGLAWIEKAVAMKHPPAMLLLGKMLLESKSWLPADPGRALSLLQGAAEAGDVAAIKELVLIYRNGIEGVAKDLALAQSWEAKLPRSDKKGKTGAGKKEKGSQP